MCIVKNACAACSIDRVMDVTAVVAIIIVLVITAGSSLVITAIANI